jgi:hypothetical protein
MDILHSTNHSMKKLNIEYFVHLVRIAMADNIIGNSEMELLHRMGKKLGFTDPEINNLIETKGRSDYIPPNELSKRFERVYDVVMMTLVDGAIDKNEMRLVRGFIVKSGFKEREIPYLLILLIGGIGQGKNEEELFEVYKKEKKTLKEPIYSI